MQPYLIAVAGVTLATGIGLALQQVVATNPIAFLLMVPPILVTAMTGGLRHSLFATLLGGLLAEYAFRIPYLTLPKDTSELVPLSLYFIIGTGISILADRVARARDENARLYTQAQEANLLKDEFLATLSHELRTPLNALLGWIQLLRSGQLPPDRHERALAAIERSAELQARLTSDLLDLSAAMKGKMRIEPREVALAPILEGVLESLRPAAEGKGVHLRSALSPDLPPATVDPARLQQVVWNLLSNAIKFTPQGGDILLRAGSVDGAIEIAVQDTGIGINAAFLPYVFDRFRQADAGPTRVHSGLGLGLAIVKHLVEAHGGEVRVASGGDRQGTTFTVRLPATARTADPPPRPAPLPAAAPDPRSR